MEAQQNYERRIAELESNLERAALFGKQLLDQLSLKSSECDELLERSTQYEIQLDTLRQKLHSAEREADLAAAREGNALKEIESLQEICAGHERLQRDKKTLEEKLRLLESEKHRRMQTVADLEEHLQEARTELSLAKTQIEEFKLLEKQRELLSTEPTEPVGRVDEDLDDIGTLAEKVESLQTEIENLRNILKQSIEQKELAVKESLQNENKLEEAIEEKASLERELAFSLNLVNEKNRHISELNEEIETLKAAETDPNRRGNSIFAEVEDRRIEVERKLVEATARLRFMDERQRRLKDQLAQCYTSLQIMAAHSSKADQNYVRTLEKEVIRLRAELCAAATRVTSTNSDGDTYTEKDLQDNPLAGMLLSERRQNAVLKKKIDDLIHQEGKRTDEMLRLGHELRVSQCEIEKMEKQRTILLMKLKEKQITDQSCEKAQSPEVTKEVLTEVVQETERNKLNEQKLLGSETTGVTENDEQNVTASTSAELPAFQGTFESEGAQAPLETEKDIKAVKFEVAAETETLKQRPRARGRQVTIVKRNKADNNDCKTQ